MTETDSKIIHEMIVRSLSELSATANRIIILVNSKLESSNNDDEMHWLVDIRSRVNQFVQAISELNALRANSLMLWDEAFRIEQYHAWIDEETFSEIHGRNYDSVRVSLDVLSLAFHSQFSKILSLLELVMKSLSLEISNSAFDLELFVDPNELMDWLLVQVKGLDSVKWSFGDIAWNGSANLSDSKFIVEPWRTKLPIEQVHIELTEKGLPKLFSAAYTKLQEDNLVHFTTDGSRMIYPDLVGFATQSQMLIMQNLVQFCSDNLVYTLKVIQSRQR